MIQPRFVDTYSYQTALLVPSVSWKIYGHPTNFNYFVTTPLVPASEAGRSFTTTNRKAHSRRKYIGDPTPSNVGASTVFYMSDPGRKVGNAVPGWNFILDDGLEKRQFTTDGDVSELIQYLEDAVSKEVRVYTQGARYIVTPGDGDDS